MKTLNCIIFLVLALVAKTKAQDFSYVYIQGDKQTPFYVKLEDEMMPRYGKNYSIISQLAPGPINLQILFQQNAFPPQKFAVNVPENGSRGFLLMRKNDAYVLYDVQQQFYIQAGNKIEDDRAPAGKEEIFIPVEHKTTPVVAKEIKTKASPPVKKPKKDETIKIVKRTETAGPQFMGDIELNNQHAVQPGDKKVIKNEVAIVNSDCPAAIDNNTFNKLLDKTTDKDNDDRLKYLLEQMSNCFTSNQARILARTLKTDAERYTFLKNAYSRITDQSAFPNLENLLTTEEWKNYFRSMLIK